MRIVLIATPAPFLDDDRLEAPLGLLYMATYLRKHGVKAVVVDLSSIPAEEWLDHIPRGEIYGFSTYTANYALTLELKRKICRQHPEVLTVAGGPHASALPEQVAVEFDTVVVGEGERALLRIVHAFCHGDRPGIVHGVPEPELDRLPFPDRSLVEQFAYGRLVEGRPALSLLSSRGCRNRCRFCNSLVMRSGGVRYRSAANVGREIEELMDRWTISHFRFNDDNFCGDRTRLQEIARRLASLDIRFRVFARADDLAADSIADLLYEAGCRHVSIGAESGSDPLLKSMAKGLTRSNIRRGVQRARAAGLKVRAFWIVGWPGETEETIRETVAFARELAPDEFTVYPAIPYPGTALYRNPRAFGITHIEQTTDRYIQVGRGRRSGCVMRTHAFDEEQVEAWRLELIDELSKVSTWAGDSINNR